MIIMMKLTRDSAHTALEVANMQRVVANMATFTLDPKPFSLVMMLNQYREEYETDWTDKRLRVEKRMRTMNMPARTSSDQPSAVGCRYVP